MQVKLANHHKHTYQEVISQKGEAHFVTYRWIIPLPLFYPVRRFSKIYFIDRDTKTNRYAGKYNIINFLIGWWGLPFGPVFLWQSIFLNWKGGLDVTEDVYLNLTPEDYEKGVVNIEEVAIVYNHPPKNELKEFSKILKTLNEQGLLSQTLWVGYYLDTEKDEAPYFVIGFDEEVNTALEAAFEKTFYKRFYKKSSYRLRSMQDDFEGKEVFLKQAKKLEIKTT
jgi:hypothetical protein